MRAKRTRVILTILGLLTTTSLAGTRGPGNYAGVVLYDRWGTCYLFSGVYLMYISSKESAKLRKYTGKSILLNAKNVYQPINPGDGLISSLEVIGEPPVNPYHPEARSIELRLEGDAEHANAKLIVYNTSPKAVLLHDVLGFALLGLKGNNRFSPSDGDSEAWLTRQRLKTIKWGDKEQYHIRVVDEDLTRLRKEITAGGTVIIHMQISLPPGQYNFVCGYGGDVHEYYSVVHYGCFRQDNCFQLTDAVLNAVSIKPLHGRPGLLCGFLKEFHNNKILFSFQPFSVFITRARRVKDQVRIISAREIMRNERKIYEEG